MANWVAVSFHAIGGFVDFFGDVAQDRIDQLSGSLIGLTAPRIEIPPYLSLQPFNAR